MPWLYDDEATKVLRHFVLVKQKLLPYLLEKAKENHDTGIPLVRAMVLAFPEVDTVYAEPEKKAEVSVSGGPGVWFLRPSIYAW